ncbi:ABC transporter permease [Pimelobacter simplex]|uniref:ABC transporter permease n=1 Tax=Nocardioides simplex TaxID=2045 RepID=UPI001933C2D3|nr:ABC transporter permease [Pimelobacter simplex]
MFVVLFVVYSFWVPETFLVWGTWTSLFDASATTALIAVGLVLPFAAGVFDLAIGAEVGLAAILVAWLLTSGEMPISQAILLTLVAGAVAGAASGLLIVRARIDSFIATLGLSSVLLAAIAWVSNGQQILNLPLEFQSLATDRHFGVTNAVLITLVVSLAIWYVLERTPLGRRVYATGSGPEAARLSGVHTTRVIVVCLIASGVVAAGAGILISSRLGVGAPTVGPSYLLPAIAAVFLGSTQFKGGRPNVWGTVIAVYVLAVGVKGLQLGGAPVWIPDLFNGAALLIAVGAARYQGRSRPRAAARKG